MTNFFADPKHIAALKTEVESWRGTPFHRNCHGEPKKGIAADCVTFAAQVLINVGAITPILWPRYVTHAGGRNMFALLLKTVQAVPQLAFVAEPKPETLLPGDLLMCSTRVSMHHLALYLADKVAWHCLEKYGVCEANVFDHTIWSIIQGVYRPVMA